MAITSSNNMTLVPIESKGSVDIEVPSGFSLLENQVNSLGNKTDFLTILMTAVVIALFIGLITMFATLTGVFTDIWRQNVTSYLDYQESAKKYEQKSSQLEQAFAQIEKRLDKIDTKLDTPATK